MHMNAGLFTLFRKISSRFERKESLTHDPLTSLIVRTIREEGPITIEHYMALALQHAKYGYYRHGNPIGAGGDFATAPEFSPIFGEMIGRWCIKTWEKLGNPQHFALLELGPGRGTLLHDIFQTTLQSTAFHEGLQLYLLESSETLREIQNDKLIPFHNPIHINTLEELPHIPTIIIANEFFDNIPIRQFVRTRDAWAERLIGWEKNEFVFILGDSELSPDWLPDVDFCQHTGWVHEVSLQSQLIVRKLADHLGGCAGAGLIIDYGYTIPEGISTLHGWRHHKMVNILETPGRIDVTANVDFTALKLAASTPKTYMQDIISQGAFLNSLGIQEKMGLLSEDPTVVGFSEMKELLYRLTESPRMGDLFKVMVIRSKS